MKNVRLARAGWAVTITGKSIICVRLMCLASSLGTGAGLEIFFLFNRKRGVEHVLLP